MAQSPYDFALTKLGKGEAPDRDDLRKYLATGGADLDPKTTAWCAAFVNSSLGQAGIKGTGSNMARSFLKWGEETKEPAKGDLAVFSRGNPNSPFGHVGFFDSMTPDGKIRVLGGNQGNAVSYAAYDPGKLLGFRRAPAPGGPSISEQVAANQTQTAPQAPGTPAPALPAPINVNDRSVAQMGSMSPQPQGSVPDSIMAAANPQPQTDKMGAMFAAMMQPPEQPQPQPVQFRGPSQEQANALSSFIAALKQRMA